MAEAYEIRQKISNSLLSPGDIDKKDVIYLYHILREDGQKCKDRCFLSFFIYDISHQQCIAT